jgi:hypothetical protein
MQYKEWNDLNSSIKMHIVHLMCNSFNHKYTVDFYNKINIRFNKKSAIIGLFIENEIVEGILVFWKCNRFVYLDKFFSVNVKTGIGSKMLTTFLEDICNEHSFTLFNKKLLLRTNTKTSYFYLKHPTIINLFTNKKYIYLGTDHKNHWEYEDLYDINVDSCFE